MESKLVKTEAEVKYHEESIFKKIKKQKFYLLTLAPFLIYLFVFKYYPMYGMIIAFKRFSFAGGIMGSDWAGFTYFKMFLKSPDLPMVLQNTLAMSSLNLVFVTFASLVFAILVCEIKNLPLKKVAQTISYLPHFISWVVVVGMTMTLLSIDGGPVNNILTGLHLTKEPINFLGNKNMFWGLVTSLNVWKETGWNSIIYIASITSIDPTMFEAAIVDGAGKLKQILYITLPAITPTIVILLIFSLGYVLNAGFEQQFFLQNPLNFTKAEVLDTYVFKYGLQKAMYSYGAAVGLMKSIIGLILVLISNKLSRKFFKMGVF